MTVADPSRATIETTGLGRARRDRPFGAGPIVAGGLVIASFLAVFAIWATLVPLGSAIVAAGVVSVDTNRKTVQHLEGGIIDMILVRDGDRVAQGQVLIQLKETVPVAAVNQLRAQYFEARATEARLVAERDGSIEVSFPTDLLAGSSEHFAASAAMAGQRAVFATRRKLQSDRVAILHQRVTGLEEEIVGLRGQVTAANKQTVLLDEELTGALRLLEKNLIERPRVLALQRRKAEVEGSISEYRASIARANQGISEARLRITELQATAVTEVVGQLGAVSAQAYEIGQRLKAAEDVLKRTLIRAPLAGTVVGLRVHTQGGVVTAGQPLLDIVPSGEQLVVQAWIDPSDIDEVREGLPAQVRLIALNRRYHTPVPGSVRHVSADRLTDPQSGAAYYLARVELNPDAWELKQIALQAGMSAEVMIQTGARTTFEYLSAPITQALGRSMRER
jgi:membrane fusion protein, epimerase transport system